MITIVCTQPTSVTNANQFTGFLPFLLQGPRETADTHNSQLTAAATRDSTPTAVSSQQWPQDSQHHNSQLTAAPSWFCICSLCAMTSSVEMISFKNIMCFDCVHSSYTPHLVRTLPFPTACVYFHDMLLCMYTYILYNLAYIFIHM